MDRAKKTIAAASALLLIGAAACSARTDLARTPGASRDAAAVAEIQALTAPAGADPATFEALKSTLASLLAQQPRAASKVTDAAVKDLKVLAAPDGGVQLSWSFANDGDYDQNGEVAVSDITPLGLHFGAQAGSPSWPEEQVADGDRNGEINLADISPIGSNFGGKLEGYRIFAQSPTENKPALIAELAVEAGGILPGQSIRRFVYDGAAMPEGTVYSVAPFQGSDEGEISNPATLTLAAPEVLGVSPLTGKAGGTLRLAPDIGGSIPATYAWHFGGGITPESSNAESPELSLGDAGTFACSLLVDNQLGRDEFLFDIVVSPNAAPNAHLAALPGSGSGAGSTRLDASGSTDSDGSLAKFEWDFDGDSQWDAQSGSTAFIEHAYAPGSHTAQVRVTDNDGATDIASVSFKTEDPNLPPEAYLNVTPSSFSAPTAVHFDATGSFDPDGTIVKYEWDPYGSGLWTNASAGSATLDLTFDAPAGQYQAAVRVTDDEGKTSVETFKLTVTGVQFLPVASEAFKDFSKPGDSNAAKWLKNMYKPLGEVRDPDRAYQSAYFCMWADKVIELVNAERMKHGLTTVKREPHLELVIQAHVRDLALQNYFDHNNLLGMDPGDRLYTINPPVYDYWGENLNAGAGYTNGNTLPDMNGPDQVMADWMNSQKHRDNILRPQYEYVGVGLYYLPSGPFRCYWGLLFGGGPDGDPATAEYIYPLDVQ